MANLNYTRRLANLKARRFDEDLLKADLSGSFGKSLVPENLEYLVESMRPIDGKYNEVTLTAASNVQKHLEGGLNTSYGITYRKQGSVMTNTNIRIYSDIDLLTIINGYCFLAPALLPPESPYHGVPNSDISVLRTQSTDIMTARYDEVDTSGSKSIEITNKNLRRKVDVVFAFWYNTKQYEDTKNEYYRGIYLFDFPKRQKLLDYPFAHIHNVNRKSSQTNDGSCKAIRLLKTLRADANKKIDLTSFQLTTMVYAMENGDLHYTHRGELTIAKNVSRHLDKMLSDEVYRKGIKSPNGMEHPFKNDKCVPHLQLIKQDLDKLIFDCESEIRNIFIKKSFFNY